MFSYNSKMRSFIYIAYNGKNYCGWQNQPNGTSVQQKIEETLSILLRKPIAVVGAGRTDAGVHASLMVAHFDHDPIFEPDGFAEKMNRMLPGDIAIRMIKPVHEDAHARFDAVSRTYKYYVTTKKNPFRNDFSCRISFPLDFEAMNRAASILFDYIDFTSFSKLHTDVKTNNCKIMQAEWIREEEDMWVFTIKADRFLRNMVRAIVGTLLDVGRKKITEKDFRAIIEQKDRCKAGTSVPPQALFLVDVEYPY